MGFGHYRHDEKTGSIVDNAFKNRGRNVRLEFVHAPMGDLTGIFGVQHLYQDSQALDLHTLDYQRQNLLHDHTSTQNSLFAIERLSLGAV